MARVPTHLRTLLLGTALAIFFPIAAAREVLVVLPGGEQSQATFTEILRRAFPGDSGERDVTRIRFVSASEAMPNRSVADPFAIVAVGTAATRAAVESRLDASILAVGISRRMFESLDCADPALRRRKCSAIFGEQPAARVLETVRAALPTATRVGVVMGSLAERDSATLQAESRARGLLLQQRLVEQRSDLFRELEGVLRASDVLLALPDPRVLDATSARDILLTAYRYSIPVVTTSRSLAEAGALVAVYTTPEQLARQSVEWITRAAAGRDVAVERSRYPRYFSVWVNRRVAASLNLWMADDAELATRIEGGRE